MRSDAASTTCIVHQGHFTWRFFVPPPDEKVLARFTNPVALLQSPERHLRKPSATGNAVVQLPAGTLFELPVVLKQYKPRNFRDQIKDLLRGARPLRAARWAEILQSLGIPSIKPLAAGWRRFQPWDAFLVSQWIAPTTTFQEYAFANPRTLARRHAILGLASIMARLHNHRISHQDAHLANFILRLEPAPEVMLVDLDGLRRFPRLTWKRAARDLQRLLYWNPLSRSEQLRFIIAYCQGRAERVQSRKLLDLIGSQYQGPPSPLRK
jgi:tRNA A-37 threonylcarbamoyl transferase component Bud32